MASLVAFAVCFSAGVILRLSLFRTSLPAWLATRPEISTPLTSWDRAMEGVALADNLISPYTGDIFHENPLMLRLLGVINKLAPKGMAVNYVFLILDVISGIILMKVGKQFGRHMLSKQVSEVKKYATGVDKILLTKRTLEDTGIYLVAVHFLNPYSVAVCLARSTAVFTNLTVYLSFLFLLQGNELLCALAIALATFQSLYPIMLCIPAAIFFYLKNNPRAEMFFSRPAIHQYVQTICLTVICWMGLMGAAYFLEGSNKFVMSTYGFILGVPDLTPNLGVFWYFFTEMFEHFRTFFICVFQINAFLYTAPLAVRLREHPVFLMYVLVMLMSIFKSYPSYADVALFITLLPLWKHVFSYMRNTFIVTNMFLCCAAFAPILWHLWIFSGSANANFYFAIALTFSTAEIFLVTDLLFAYLRREFDLRNGLEHKLENGKTAQVIMD